MDDTNKKLTWVSNSVELIGFLRYKSLSRFTNDYPRLKAKLEVHVSYDFGVFDETITSSFIKIVAWGDLAESLYDVEEGARVLVTGVLQEKEYIGKCNHCGANQKKYWSDVLVTNFVLVD